MGCCSKCDNCRFSIGESHKQCFINCKVPKRFWKAICLALASSLAALERKCPMYHSPRSNAAQTTLSTMTRIEHPWDVLKTCHYWQIWCARCRKTFANGGMNVSQMCHTPWSDIIKANMAHRSQIMKCVEFKSVDNELAIETQFASTWCIVEVLCIGNIFHIRLLGILKFCYKIN